MAVLTRFYTAIDKSTYDELLADSFKMTTAAPGHSTYGKAGPLARFGWAF